MVMDSNALKDLVYNALEDRKAVDIRVLDVRKLTDITDYMVIASGRSHRQVKAMAQHVTQVCKDAGQAPMGCEGMEYGDWVLIDVCDVIVHMMVPEVRDFYQLEKLWGGSETTLPNENVAP